MHLSTVIPAIKEKLEDADERLGADIVQKVKRFISFNVRLLYGSILCF